VGYTDISFWSKDDSELKDICVVTISSEDAQILAMNLMNNNSHTEIIVNVTATDFNAWLPFVGQGAIPMLVYRFFFTPIAVITVLLAARAHYHILIHKGCEFTVTQVIIFMTFVQALLQTVWMIDPLWCGDKVLPYVVENGYRSSDRSQFKICILRHLHNHNLFISILFYR
jgi:hypothetical protein